MYVRIWVYGGGNDVYVYVFGSYECKGLYIYGVPFLPMLLNNYTVSAPYFGVGGDDRWLNVWEVATKSLLARIRAAVRLCVTAVTMYLL